MLSHHQSIISFHHRMKWTFWVKIRANPVIIYCALLFGFLAYSGQSADHYFSASLYQGFNFPYPYSSSPKPVCRMLIPILCKNINMNASIRQVVSLTNRVYQLTYFMREMPLWPRKIAVGFEHCSYIAQLYVSHISYEVCTRIVGDALAMNECIL